MNSTARYLLTFVLLISLTFSAFLHANSLVTGSNSIKPALWQLSYQGNTSYLFGSIHIGDGGWYPLAPPVMKAFNKSQALIVELDAISSGPQLQQAMNLPQGKTLATELMPATYEKLSNYALSYGLPMAAIERLKPWAAATVISILPYMKLGLMPQFGVDAHFLNLATNANKGIIELETPQFQLNLLESLFENEESLLEVIDLPQSDIVDLVNFWKAGDMPNMARLIQRQMDAKQIKLMLTQRNKDWGVKIKKLMSNKSSHFIVVGAAHLAGRNGVPALLAKQGVVVKLAIA